MTTAINIDSLLKTYPDGTQALKGVSLSVEKGGFFALLGPNGAGKSTLIKLVTTLYKKDEGYLMIDGSDPDTDFKRVQRAIGVASQDNELDPGETTLALLRFQGRLFGMSKTEANKRAEELIDLFDLQPVSDKRTADLSGGNKRRLHCALALVHKPSILFLDEPTVGMDPLARSLFWEVITRLNREEGVTVFLTTQYLEEADKHANDMALIVDGRIHYAGSIAGFKQRVHPKDDSSLEESYLTYIKNLNTVSERSKP